MAGVIEHLGRKRGIPEALWMTVGVSDGRQVWAVRYASDKKPPTLYYSRDMDDIARLAPQARERLGSDARLIVSEPVGEIASAWVQVPVNSWLTVRGAETTVGPFIPVPPG
jgi:glutamine amidotransferase